MKMRVLALVLSLSAVALPCSAQTILKYEPLVLAPYEVAFVQDASCAPGNVLKVTGAIRGLQRKRACVALSSTQTSIVVATPARTGPDAIDPESVRNGPFVAGP